MRAISILVLLFVSVTTYAFNTEATIILKNKERPERATNIEFKVDKSGLGRAWVTVDLVYHDFDDFEIVTERLKVPGLVHDTATKEILLNGTVCAITKRVKKRRLFRKSKWITKIKETGRCKFRPSISRKLTTIDEGFDVVRERRYFLTLQSNI